MQTYQNPNLVLETAHLQEGNVAWNCPSNIALIKYWGKYGVQLPKNPSISFTLNNACTQTNLSFSPNNNNRISFDFYFHDKVREDFKPKIQSFLERLTEIYPFLKQLHLKIESSNTFPHSTGIASSASSMGALALCLCSLEEKLFDTKSTPEDFFRKASYIARIGSGSAARSVFPVASLWGEFPEIPESSNEYGIPFKDIIHPVFHTFHDAILIVSDEEKSVSSSAGHGLMEGNVYADSRYQQAKTRMHFLLSALRSGDLDTFGRIVEDEALTLHALMMTSNPSYLLMRPGTLSIIEKLRKFRSATHVPLYFTLDAGPNVHLLYPESYSEIISDFIREELSQFCNENILHDVVGVGPKIR